MNKNQFWERLEALVIDNKVTIDRPKGSSHPNFAENIYPLDYGFIGKTQSGDNDEVDIWIGSQKPAILNGIICTIDELKRDIEIKILWGCTDEEMERVFGFHNSGSQSGILVKKPG
jgi:inorganic pyrophosphatase